MTDVAKTLASSRSQQLQARGALRAGNSANARELFVAALESRLAADAADPMHLDPAWLDDALHPPMPGERLSRYHRIPGKSVAQVAAEKHREIVDYLRLRVGEIAPLIVTPSDPEIVVPQNWRVVTAGDSGICATCAHPRAWHVDDEVPEDRSCRHADCACKVYSAAPCRHVWALNPDGSARLCSNCTEEQALEPSMKREDTIAYQQCEAEKRGKA